MLVLVVVPTMQAPLSHGFNGQVKSVRSRATRFVVSSSVEAQMMRAPEWWMVDGGRWMVDGGRENERGGVAGRRATGDARWTLNAQ